VGGTGRKGAAVARMRAGVRATQMLWLGLADIWWICCTLRGMLLVVVVVVTAVMVVVGKPRV
jgi:hypothetical protein